ncbi:MAG: PASTA domain-containing protein, partial [Cytophagales bacterium]|nr:PASTA domain-containing protein [Cytophagales bacterium]
IGNGQGANDLKAPDLIGKTEDEAKFLIEASGLNLGVPIVVSDTAGAPGTVIRQNPLPGTAIKSGDLIDIWIVPGGSGPPPNQ